MILFAIGIVSVILIGTMLAVAGSNLAFPESRGSSLGRTNLE